MCYMIVNISFPETGPDGGPNTDPLAPAIRQLSTVPFADLDMALTALSAVWYNIRSGTLGAADDPESRDYDQYPVVLWNTHDPSLHRVIIGAPNSHDPKVESVTDYLLDPTNQGWAAQFSAQYPELAVPELEYKTDDPNEVGTPKLDPTTNEPVMVSDKFTAVAFKSERDISQKDITATYAYMSAYKLVKDATDTYSDNHGDDDDQHYPLTSPVSGSGPLSPTIGPITPARVSNPAESRTGLRTLQADD